MVLFTASLADDALIFRLCHLLRLTFAHNECRAVLCFIEVLRISSYLSLNILSFLFSKGHRVHKIGIDEMEGNE